MMFVNAINYIRDNLNHFNIDIYSIIFIMVISILTGLCWLYVEKKRDAIYNKNLEFFKAYHKIND